MVKDASCNVAKVTELVQSHVPTAKLESEISAELSYLLPFDQSKSFANLFSDVEQKKSSLGIQSFGTTATTMEEVFLKWVQTHIFQEICRLRFFINRPLLHVIHAVTWFDSVYEMPLQMHGFKSPIVNANFFFIVNGIFVIASQRWYLELFLRLSGRGRQRQLNSNYKWYESEYVKLHNS